MLSSMIGGEITEYLDTGKVLAKGAADEDIMFARPGPSVEFWEGEDELRATLSIDPAAGSRSRMGRRSGMSPDEGVVSSGG
jgi:hypothetical protein